MNNEPDGQKSRSIATQQALMQAAEKLIANKGIENVSIREIVKEAGQKNESALQYHFKNLKGLIKSIRQSREQEVQAKRTSLLKELLDKSDKPNLRDLCNMMILPSFLLAQADAEFCRYIIAFSPNLALSEESALSMVQKHGGGGESGRETGKLLRGALPHLDKEAYQRRMDNAVRLVAISIGHHARQQNAFHGPEAMLFLNNLIDAVVGLLGAPVSEETRQAVKSLRSKKKQTSP